jgi:hypothetical protein
LRKGEPAAWKYFGVKLLAALARAYSPNEEKTFLSATMPVTYIGDSAIVNKDALKKWEGNFPLNMIKSHLSALKSHTRCQSAKELQNRRDVTKRGDSKEWQKVNVH